MKVRITHGGAKGTIGELVHTFEIVDAALVRFAWPTEDGAIEGPADHYYEFDEFEFVSDDQGE